MLSLSGEWGCDTTQQQQRLEKKMEDDGNVEYSDKLPDTDDIENAIGLLGKQFRMMEIRREEEREKEIDKALYFTAQVAYQVQHSINYGLEDDNRENTERGRKAKELADRIAWREEKERQEKLDNFINGVALESLDDLQIVTIPVKPLGPPRQKGEIDDDDDEHIAYSGSIHEDIARFDNDDDIDIESKNYCNKAQKWPATFTEEEYMNVTSEGSEMNITSSSSPQQQQQQQGYDDGEENDKRIRPASFYYSHNTEL